MCKLLLSAASFLLILFASPLTAHAGICSAVKWKSLGKISCYHKGSVAVLIYDSRWSYNKVVQSGQHQNLLHGLCEEGAITLKEIIIAGENDITINTRCDSLKEHAHE